MVQLNGNGYHPTLTQNNLQPHDVEAEEAVLGSLLIDPDAIIKVAANLCPADFFTHWRGWVYEAMRELFNRGVPANDSLLITGELVRLGHPIDGFGGESILLQLRGQTFTSLNIEHYAKIVAEMATRRRVINAAGEMARLAHNPEILAEELLSRSEKMLLDIGGDGTTEVEFADELTEQVGARLDRVYQARGKGITGMPTGLSDLDRLIGGFQNDELIVFGGRPGMGKSALALQIAKYTAQKFNKRWLIFSLEMSAMQLFQRLIATEAGIDSNRLRIGDINENEWPAFIKSQETISHLPIAVYDDVSLTPQTMRSKAIRHHAKYGLDGIILDYLQLMDVEGKGKSRVEQTTEISRTLKKMARELHIPVIAISSLNRSLESRTDKRPMMSDLRDSGSIESDADVVIFLYRDDVYNPDTELPNIAEVIVSKHRSAPTGIFSVYFKKHLTQFLDLEVRRQPIEYIG